MFAINYSSGGIKYEYCKVNDKYVIRKERVPVKRNDVLDKLVPVKLTTVGGETLPPHLSERYTVIILGGSIILRPYMTICGQG